MFSHSWRWSSGTRCFFFRASHLLTVYPHLVPIARFPALGTACMFSRACQCHSPAVVASCIGFLDIFMFISDILPWKVLAQCLYLLWMARKLFCMASWRKNTFIFVLEQECKDPRLYWKTVIIKIYLTKGRCLVSFMFSPGLLLPLSPTL